MVMTPLQKHDPDYLPSSDMEEEDHKGTFSLFVVLNLNTDIRWLERREGRQNGGNLENAIIV